MHPPILLLPNLKLGLMKALLTTVLLLATFLSTNMVLSQELEQTETKLHQAADASALAAERWEQIDASVERSFEWLATQQREDGSFESPDSGQPGVTSLCLMAFLAQGESPANGKYQLQLTNAVKFIATQQQPNGLIATTAPGAVPIPRTGFGKTLGSPSVYNLSLIHI